MLTLLAVLGVLAIFFVAAAVATREGEVLVDAPADAADLRLPSGPLQPHDVASVRFGLALRGYRMAEVDEVLDRVQAELAERDSRILQLEDALSDRPVGDQHGLGTVAAPSAALLAPVLSTQQTVPAPLGDGGVGGTAAGDERHDEVHAGDAPVDEGVVDHGNLGDTGDGPAGDGPAGDGPADDGPADDGPADDGPAGDGPADDGGWAFDDGGSARSAARVTSDEPGTDAPVPDAAAPTSADRTDDDWGMPQVLDLEPAAPGLTDAVETPDPEAAPFAPSETVPAAGSDEQVHDAEPVPVASDAPPSWGGPASTPPDTLPPGAADAPADPFAPGAPARPSDLRAPWDAAEPEDRPEPEDLQDLSRDDGDGPGDRPAPPSYS